jgi:hypothetical protein
LLLTEESSRLTPLACSVDDLDPSPRSPAALDQDRLAANPAEADESELARGFRTATLRAAYTPTWSIVAGLVGFHQGEHDDDDSDYPGNSNMLGHSLGLPKVFRPIGGGPLPTSAFEPGAVFARLQAASVRSTIVLSTNQFRRLGGLQPKQPMRVQRKSVACPIKRWIDDEIRPKAFSTRNFFQFSPENSSRKSKRRKLI